ncbi:hypothetical protein Tco_1506549 [Tanacetum coccineum]
MVGLVVRIYVYGCNGVGSLGKVSEGVGGRSYYVEGYYESVLLGKGEDGGDVGVGVWIGKWGVLYVEEEVIWSIWLLGRVGRIFGDNISTFSHACPNQFNMQEPNTLSIYVICEDKIKAGPIPRSLTSSPPPALTASDPHTSPRSHDTHIPAHTSRQDPPQLHHLLRSSLSTPNSRLTIDYSTTTLAS